MTTSAAEYDRLRKATAPSLLVRLARAKPDSIAFRSKHRGIYRERSWADYARHVARCAAAFERLGLKTGDRVAIMGDPCEEWVFCDLAAQALGCITYGIYPTASSEELEYQMRDGGAVVFVAENQEYVDRLLTVADNLRELHHLIVIDDTAMFAYEDSRLQTYGHLMEGEHADIDWLEERAGKLDPSAPAFIVYTSGTTGAPKGALISHGKHLAATFNIVEHYPMLNEKEQRTVVFLPLCHVLGRDIAITLPMLCRLVPHYGEDMDDLSATIFEVAPTVLFSVPRYLQKFASQILVGMSNTDGVKRGAYDFAIRCGRRAARKRWAGGSDGIAYSVAWYSVFRPILNKLGFDKLDLVISGGAPLPAETAMLWQMFGVNVVEMYGQTETAGGIVAGQQGPFAKPGTVGTVPPGWEVRLDAAGEIQVRSPDLFDGYWNNEKAGRDALTGDGWLKTGDVGQWDEGSLRLIDRARDFIVTSGGKTISPAYVENVMRASPYLSEIVVFGHGRKYLTALVEIDFEMVSDWARANDVAYSGFTNLAENPRVRELMQAELARCNEKLARVEQIKAFRILPKVLDPEEEGDPVTATRKVKRSQMHERFRELVDGMYDDREERMVAAAIGSG